MAQLPLSLRRLQTIRFLPEEMWKLYKYLRLEPTATRPVSPEQIGETPFSPPPPAEPEPILRGHIGTIRALRFAPDGTLLLSASTDGSIRVWDFVNRREHIKLTGHDDYVFAADFSPDGRWVVSGGSDQTVRIWSLKRKREAFCFRGHEES